jgi:hypothetical protein
MFDEEQEHLLPLYGTAPITIGEEMDRQVRRDNTVLYKSNRYSVPYGTYTQDKKVFLAVTEGQLQIMNRAGDVLAAHDISEDKGQLIRPAHHRRDKSERIKALREKTISLLGEGFREYISQICEVKPRYVKEQLDITVNACETYGRERVLAAMAYCREMGLYSANDLRDAAAYILLPQTEQDYPNPNRLPVEDERYHVSVQKRALAIYAEAAAVGSLGVMPDYTGKAKL